MVLNQSDPSRGAKNWSDVRYILKPTEYTERLYWGGERKRVKDNFEVWGLSINTNGVATYRDGKD